MICPRYVVRCGNMRRAYCLLGLFAIFPLLLILFHAPPLYRSKLRRVPSYLSSLYDVEEDLIVTPTCRIPDFDPWDSEVSGQFLTEPVVLCQKAPPFFIKPKVQGNRTIPFLDQPVLWRHYRLTKRNIRCRFRSVVRNDTSDVPDTSYKLLNWTVLNFDEAVDAEYIWIECSKYKFEKKFYEQPLLLVKPQLHETARESISSRKLYNVIVVGYDSVSRLNFHRQLAKTRKFLQERPETVIELLAYNKVGLNSQPNQIPLLTGHQAFPGVFADVRRQYVDNATRYIWQDFRDMGYSTMFFEEQWSWGIFVWPDVKGFLHTPTDYWPRPIFQMIDASNIKQKLGTGICLGPRPAASTYLDYVLDLLRTSRRPLWLYPWLSELSHNYFTGAGRADESFFNFFTTLEEEGFLKNTTIFFISDHGFRFGDFRNTPIGRYEDQLPFGFIIVPRIFANEHPHAISNLRTNARRLVTAYDLHATMLDLATSSSTNHVTRTQFGYSLFSEIVPINRTCADARIGFDHCACYGIAWNERIQPDLRHRLGQAIVDEINDIIERNQEIQCARWRLTNVTQVFRLQEGTTLTNAYRVTIKTYPPAEFETILTVSPNSNKAAPKRVSQIDRTDWFHESSLCVDEWLYKRLCYCLGKGA